ncbi:MAG TPA: glycosyltransferase family 4 protein [Chitinophagaceae bacterium]|nr:glycosyltransferase family 4 protein [Chitinophagaceae bacterium]
MNNLPKKRILILLNRLAIGGVAQDVVSLAYYLSRDFEVLLLFGKKNDDEEDASDLLKEYNGFSTQQISSLKRSINFFQDIKAYYQIKKILLSFKPCIVHTHGAKPGFIGRIAARACKVPVIIHTYHGHVFHSYYNKLITSIILKIERWLSSFTTNIITVSHSQEKEIGSLYKICHPEKITIIPLGIEAEKFKDLPQKRELFRKEFFLDPGEIAIGIIGRLVPVKNHLFFLEAVKDIVNSMPQVRIFIIGDGEMREYLEDFLRDEMISFTYFPMNAIKTPITFTSWQTNIIKVIAGLDIVVLSSLNEGTPLSLLEGQAGGKPIVATKVGGVSEIVRNQSTGYLIDPGDIKQFAEKLKLLIENETIRLKMGAEAQKFVQSNFTKQKQVSAHKALYTRLAEHCT